MLPGRTACYNCIFPGLDEDSMPTCSIEGVHPSILSVVGGIEVAEAARVVMGREPALSRRILHIDLESMEFTSTAIERVPECPVCGDARQEAEPSKDLVLEELCGRHGGKRTYSITPGGRVTPGMIREWDGMLETREVSVTLPKFTLTSGYDLRGYLEEAGMPDVFDPADADLSGIADPGPLNIYVTKAAHDTFLDVHEKGTEAAATTTIVSSFYGLSDPPVYFAADRPFIFAILDDASGAILFMGRLSEPPAFGGVDPDIDYYYFIEPPPQLSTANNTVLAHPVPDSYSGENVAVIPLGAASTDCSRTGICFAPPETTIQRGEALTWFNADAIDHMPGLYTNLDSDPEHAHYSYMEPGDSHSHVFEEPGRYTVICGLHPWMIGGVVVE
ncbi:hypothetical protein IBTHAUMO2_470041 [Nitrosopumilaceae archaeon]|nr:hypothetical protein IBTHAUMO2_470041 [Nitrosopumilaceae archaeon]